MEDYLHIDIPQQQMVIMSFLVWKCLVFDNEYCNQYFVCKNYKKYCKEHKFNRAILNVCPSFFTIDYLKKLIIFVEIDQPSKRTLCANPFRNHQQEIFTIMVCLLNEARDFENKIKIKNTSAHQVKL